MKRCLFVLAAMAIVGGNAMTALVRADEFRLGGRDHGRGRVKFEVAGGAGESPRFEIGGDRGRDFFRRVGRRFDFDNIAAPVAVGWGGWSGSCYFGEGGFSNLYNQGFIPVPPYFALHPPVYYSVPVPRSYGYSPFAYPAGVPTPEVALGPEVIENPHVEPEEAPAPAEPSSAKTAAAPVVIRNPYVDQPQPVSFAAAQP